MAKSNAKGKKRRQERARIRREIAEVPRVKGSALNPIIKAAPQGDLSPLSPMAIEIAGRWGSNGVEDFERIRRA